MFDDIVGHERERRAFAEALSRWRDGRGALHHAYLLTGGEEYPRHEPDAGPGRPLGQGQWRLALELGATIVAGDEGGGAEYERALTGLHPNLHLIAREGDLIRVEQLDALLHDLGLRSFGTQARVWVIDEADTLHPAAANRLLKSLEEPPADVFFLLATAEAERVLPTIVSRCHVVELGPVASADIVRHVQEDLPLAGPAAAAVAELAQGSVSRAERLAADERSGRRAARFELALRAAGGERAAREAYVEALAAHQKELQDETARRLQGQLARIDADTPDERERSWRRRRAEEQVRRSATRLARREAIDTLDTVTALVRDLWVVSAGVSGVLLNSDREADIVAAVAASPAAYERMLAAAAGVRKDLHLNVDPALALRAMFCRFEEVTQTCAK